jgi:hypothetical protein
MPDTKEPKSAPLKQNNHTGKLRVERHRKALTDAGGARVEAHLSVEDLARLDALIATGVTASRRAALKYLVQMLPDVPQPKFL